MPAPGQVDGHVQNQVDKGLCRPPPAQPQHSFFSHPTPMNVIHSSAVDVSISYSQLTVQLPPSLESAYLAEMPPAMRAPILRYRRWQDRQATLLGKMLLLRSLQMHDSQSGREKFQTLQQTSMGKPFIPGGPEFSISHSGEMIIFAVSRHRALGIDIERIREVDIEDFRTHVPEIVNFDQGKGKDDVLPLFFHHWTQKEAVAKACGMGLLAPLDTISVIEGKAFFQGSIWYVKQISLQENGYCCHLATDRQNCHFTLEKVSCTALRDYL